MAGTKIMRVYNVNVVRGRLYENYLTQKFSSRKFSKLRYM